METEASEEQPDVIPPGTCGVFLACAATGVTVWVHGPVAAGVCYQQRTDLAPPSTWIAEPGCMGEGALTSPLASCSTQQSNLAHCPGNTAELALVAGVAGEPARGHESRTVA